MLNGRARVSLRSYTLHQFGSRLPSTASRQSLALVIPKWHWTPFSSSTTATEAEYAAAREWLKSFTADTISKDACEVSYARSSGPGGQNVNKVNSKAQLRVDLNRLFEDVPALFHSAILKSRYYSTKSHSLLIQSDDSRKQAANREQCFRKLSELILDIGKEIVPGETTEAQREKVKLLKRQENERRLKDKKFHSNKKSARSKSLGE